MLSTVKSALHDPRHGWQPVINSQSWKHGLVLRFPVPAINNQVPNVTNGCHTTANSYVIWPVLSDHSLQKWHIQPSSVVQASSGNSTWDALWQTIMNHYWPLVTLHQWFQTSQLLQLSMTGCYNRSGTLWFMYSDADALCYCHCQAVCSHSHSTTFPGSVANTRGLIEVPTQVQVSDPPFRQHPFWKIVFSE